MVWDNRLSFTQELDLYKLLEAELGWNRDKAIDWVDKLQVALAHDGEEELSSTSG